MTEGLYFYLTKISLARYIGLMSVEKHIILSHYTYIQINTNKGLTLANI
jgi:hypothetical protein